MSSSRGDPGSTTDRDRHSAFDLECFLFDVGYHAGQIRRLDPADRVIHELFGWRRWIS